MATLSHQSSDPGRSPHEYVRVGGVDYSVGGWGEFVVARRAEQRRLRVGGGTGDGGGTAAEYERRRYVTGPDAAVSLLGATPASALRRAAQHFANVLRRHEAAACDADGGVWACSGPGGVVVPGLTSADLDDFCEDAAALSDPETLADISRRVTAAVADIQGVAPAPAVSAAAVLPPLPAEIVATDEPAALTRLEEGAAEYVAAVEAMRAALAAQIAEAVDIIATDAENAAPAATDTGAAGSGAAADGADVAADETDY